MIFGEALGAGEGCEIGNMQDFDGEGLSIIYELTSFSLFDVLHKVPLDKIKNLEATYEPHTCGYFLHVFGVTDCRIWKQSISQCFALPYFVPDPAISKKSAACRYSACEKVSLHHWETYGNIHASWRSKEIRS